jgi:hypothetical protein
MHPPEWKIPEVPGEPDGWRELQKKAQQETDPKKLAAIIDEINRLLTEHEQRASISKSGQETKLTAAPKLSFGQRLQ